jgi:4-hydroxybenzoyl-CoA reductase subunit alpha
MPPVESILVETLDPEGPYGAKECGQGPLLPVIPALANAIHDAIGVHLDEVPITPEKVLAALEGRYRRPVMPAVRYPETVRVAPLEAAAPAAAPDADPALRP